MPPFPDVSPVKVAKVTIAIALLLSVLYVAAVYLFGWSFGQRCAERYDKDTPEWRVCVTRLSQGESLDGTDR